MQRQRPTSHFDRLIGLAAIVTMATATSVVLAAQAPSTPAPTAPPAAPPQAAQPQVRPLGTTPSGPASVAKPAQEPLSLAPGFVLGVDDALEIRVWEDEKIAGGVIVRPDGKISLPLIGDIVAEGKTPDQLKEAIRQAALPFVNSPTVDVFVKQVFSRKVYIQGEVRKPDTYPLGGSMRLSQLISRAGGITEFGDRSKVTVVRTDKDGKTTVIKVNYKELLEGKNLQKNKDVELMPGDVVNVPD
jgi:polysaccharide biosynthesis/export protein